MSNGFIVWFTGPPGSGKTTLVTEVARHITWKPVEVIDGDVLRAELRSLGFDRRDRDLNVRMAALLARRLARHGIVVLVALISPFRQTREEVRLKANGEGIPFIEVALESALEVLARRKPALYEQAARGELELPYESPLAPEVRVDTGRSTVIESRDFIVLDLRRRGLL